jgi:hypothetical protein
VGTKHQSDHSADELQVRVIAESRAKVIDWSAQRALPIWCGRYAPPPHSTKLVTLFTVMAHRRIW